MAFIVVEPTERLHTIVTLTGGEEHRYADGKLIVDDVTQEQLDEAFATYNANLELYKIQPLREARMHHINKEVFDYVESVYPSFRRELFIALAEEARNSGLTNRVAYINQMLTWVKTIVAAVLAVEDMMNSYNTVEEIKSTSLNTEVFASTDPEITIRGAMAIED